MDAKTENTHKSPIAYENLKYTVVVTKKAWKIFMSHLEQENNDSYVRLEAPKEGCSGYKFELSTTAQFDRDNDFLFGVIVINRDTLNNITGNVTIDYDDKNPLEQGFIFTRLDEETCGCGQSFSAINPIHNNTKKSIL